MSRRDEPPMTTPKARRTVLQELLSGGRASTQAALCELLAAQGHAATQSTVSRDLKRLGASYEGAGLMFEALTAAVEYVFAERRLHRIMANYVPTNERSGRLLRRLGFAVEGYARDYLYINNKDGTYTDRMTETPCAPACSTRAIFSSLMPPNAISGAAEASAASRKPPGPTGAPFPGVG